MGCKITTKGFCRSDGDLYDLYQKEGLNMHHYLRGDFLITIEDNDKTVYISDFAGSKCPFTIPRNSTIVVQDNKIVYRKDNIETTDLFYNPPQGMHRRMDYDKLFNAISDAISIRVPKEEFSLALSSGHDSGTIGAYFIIEDRQPNILYAKGNENIDILNERLALFDNTYDFFEEQEQDSHELLAKNVKTNVLLSGLCADELHVSGDYELMEQFFYDAHLGYDKYGLDVRFPLCDPNVFREYKLLDGSLIGERGSLKLPLTVYMKSVGFPVNNGPKSSFWLW